MDRSDYDLIMAHLVRCPSLVEVARGATLAAEDFNQSAIKHYGYFWGAVSNYFESHGSAPPRIVLEREVNLAIQDEDIITDKTKTRAVEFFDFAYGLQSEELAPDYVRDNLLQEMIDELKVRPKLKVLSGATNSDELALLTTEYQDTYISTRIVACKPADMFSQSGRVENTTESAPVLTGLDFVDLAIGGLRPNSMVGVLAEPSGGKTMFGTQYLCEQALKKRRTMGFYYEQSIVGDIAERFYGYLGGASRDEMAGKTYLEYPERVRKVLDTIEDQLTEYLKIYDMSGTTSGQGHGGTEEIEAILTRHKREGTLPESIVVDWLGQMEGLCTNIPDRIKEKRHRLEYLMQRFKRLSERFGITVIILHQLAPGQIEGKSPAFKPDHTMAHEFKSFSHLVDYSFTFGRLCKVTHCMWCCVGKARGAPKTDRVVQMEAQYNKLHDANHWKMNERADRDPSSGYFEAGGRRKLRGTI